MSLPWVVSLSVAPYGGAGTPGARADRGGARNLRFGFVQGAGVGVQPLQYLHEHVALRFANAGEELAARQISQAPHLAQQRLGLLPQIQLACPPILRIGTP